MNAKDKREERWIAYHLGELNHEQRREVETEFKESPAAAAEYENLVRGIGRWADEPVPYTPLKIESLGLENIQPEKTSPFRRRLERLRQWIPSAPWSLGFAAAALAAFVLYQSEFSFKIGRIDLRWGKSGPPEEVAALQQKIEFLTAQYGDLSTAVDANKTKIRETVLQGTLQGAYLEDQINDATVQLVRLQQAESQTRYHDVQNLMYLAGLDNTRTPEWMRDASSGIGAARKTNLKPENQN